MSSYGAMPVGYCALLGLFCYLLEKMLCHLKDVEDYPKFEEDVCHKARYFMSDHANAFLEGVKKTVHEKERLIRKEQIFWRAQLGCIEKESSLLWHSNLHPYDAKRMKPEIAHATDGRANPAGIRCLYLASTANTAMSEVRPWLEAVISCAEFQIVRDLKIVDCHNNPLAMPTNSDLCDPEVIKYFTWYFIDHAFSKPISAGDRKIDYVPTQVLTEFFKSQGYDGIGYTSSLGDGYNIALFDLDSAIPINCRLYRTNEITCKFTDLERSIPYGKD